MEIKIKKLRIKSLFLIFLSFALAVCEDRIIYFAVLSSFLHEAGHLAAFLIFRVRIERITVNIFGIVIDFKEEYKISFFKESMISFAGPAVNILLFFVFYRLDFQFAAVNFALAFFNLLPIVKLDGGRVLRAVLNRILRKETAGKICFFISVLVAVPFLILGIALTLFYKNISLLITSFYFLVLLISYRGD